MATLAEQILSSYEPPNIIKTFNDIVELGNIDVHLKSRQLITITQDEMDKLAEDHDSWFFESDIDAYHNLTRSSEYGSDYDFSKEKDGYGISEYIGKYEKYIPNLYYLWYTKQNNTDILMNVYGAYSLLDMRQRNQILRDKIEGFEKLCRVNANDPEKIQGTKFDVELGRCICNRFAKTKYESKVVIPTFIDEITIISTNIPYDIYMNQPLPFNAYNYDIDKKEYFFGSYSYDEFMEILIDIRTNGITDPLFMRLDGELLSTSDDKSMAIITAALILRLPYIPVNIIITTEDNGLNKMMAGIVKDNTYKRKIYSNPSVLNKCLAPAAVIHASDISKDNLNKLHSLYNLNHYQTIGNNDIVTLRIYDESLIKEDNSDPIDDINRQNLQHAEEELNSLINAQIEKLIKKSSYEVEDLTTDVKEESNNVVLEDSVELNENHSEEGE